jgi:hypothetical protein
MASAGEVRIGLVNPRAEDDLGNAIVSRSMTYSSNPAKVEGFNLREGQISSGLPGAGLQSTYRYSRDVLLTSTYIWPAAHRATKSY